MAPDPVDTLTVLTTFGQPATKVLTRRRDGTIRKKSYGSGMWFRPTVVGVSDIRELGRALALLEPAPQSFVVRGALTADADPERMVRRTRARPGEPPTLAEVPRHWVMIDVDGVPRGDGPDPATDPEGAAAAVIDLLPPEFRRVTCWWQWSSSQGADADDTLSIHLWFWLAEPRGSADLKRWAGAVNEDSGFRLVDPALFNPAQIHYTAAPILKRGATDPLPRRSGLRIGETEVVHLRMPAAPVRAAVERAHSNTESLAGAVGFEARLQAIGGPSGFHGPIKSAIGAWFAAEGAGADGDALKALIRARLMEVGPHRPDRAHDLARYASDRFLDDLIAWTRNRQAETEAGPGHCAPFYEAPTETVAAARQRLAHLIDGFVAEAARFHNRVAEAEARATAEATARAAWNRACRSDALPEFGVAAPTEIPPPVLAVPVGVGIGKSRAAREAIAAALRGGTLQPPVVYSVPTHALGREQVDAFAALGITAVLWRGRRGDEEDAPLEAVTCFDMVAVRDAQSVGADAQTAVCKNRVGQCDHFQLCPYQRQKADVAAAEVVIVPHSSLFHRKPAAVRPPSLLVIDEGFAETRETHLSLDEIQALTAAEEAPGLAITRAQLLCALRATEPGDYVTLATLREVGMTAAAAREAHRLEWQRKVKPAIEPGMSPAARAAAVEAARGNTTIAPMAAIWRLLADGLENGHDPAGVTTEWRAGASGDSYVVVRARWLAEIKTGWADGVPVLHMDATLRPEVVRLFLAGADFAEPVDALTPQMTVRQVLGAPVTRNKLFPGEKARRKERTTAANHFRDLQAFIRLRAMALRGRGAAGGPDVLVVAQKRVVETLSEMGLPDNVDAAWFNNLAGRDVWKGVAGLIVLGRTLPPPREVEEMAVALTNRAPVVGPDHAWWYDSAVRGIRMSGGTGRGLSVSVHPDAMVETLRWSTCEGELIQTIGRGRGVNRGPDDALEVDLLADVVVPLTVDGLQDWADVCPSREDVMLSRGVWLDNAADRARAFPDLWRTLKAAEHDTSRTPPNAFIGVSIGVWGCPPAGAVVEYRRAGPGTRRRRATFDLSMIADPEAWLVEHLGPLAEFAVASANAPADVA